jgi:hypothetical protein
MRATRRMIKNPSRDGGSAQDISKPWASRYGEDASFHALRLRAQSLASLWLAAFGLDFCITPSPKEGRRSASASRWGRADQTSFVTCSAKDYEEWCSDCSSAWRLLMPPLACSPTPCTELPQGIRRLSLVSSHYCSQSRSRLASSQHAEQLSWTRSPACVTSRGRRTTLTFCGTARNSIGQCTRIA